MEYEEEQQQQQQDDWGGGAYDSGTSDPTYSTSAEAYDTQSAAGDSTVSSADQALQAAGAAFMQSDFDRAIGYADSVISGRFSADADKWQIERALYGKAMAYDVSNRVNPEAYSAMKTLVDRMRDDGHPNIAEYQRQLDCYRNGDHWQEAPLLI